MQLFFLALSCLLASASASAIPTCDECVASMGRLVERLTGEESLAEQTGILAGTICPTLDDPAGCETGLNAHWADIANAMYPVFLEGNSVCGQLGVCGVREWTCEECVDGVGQIAGIISDPVTVESVVAFLKGADFCGTTGDEATCGAFIDATIPAAMPTLAAAFVDTAEEICQGINNVC